MRGITKKYTINDIKNDLFEGMNSSKHRLTL